MSHADIGQSLSSLYRTSCHACQSPLCSGECLVTVQCGLCEQVIADQFLHYPERCEIGLCATCSGKVQRGEIENPSLVELRQTAMNVFGLPEHIAKELIA